MTSPRSECSACRRLAEPISLTASRRSWHALFRCCGRVWGDTGNNERNGR